MNQYLSVISNFPEELRRKAVPLTSPETGEVAWSFQDVFTVVNLLGQADLAILGGDVMLNTNGELRYTYDNWSTEKNELSWENYVKQSIEKTIQYIEKYEQNNKNVNHYFVLSWCDKEEFNNITSQI